MKSSPSPAKAAAVKSDHGAMDTVMQLDDRVFLERGGEVVKPGKIESLPNSLEEGFTIVNKTKEKIGEWINAISGHAAKGGDKISLDPVLGALAKVEKKEGFIGQTATRDRLVKDFAEVQSTNGGFSVPAAIRQLTSLNNDIKKVFTGQNNAGDSVEVLAIA